MLLFKELSDVIPGCVRLVGYNLDLLPFFHHRKRKGPNYATAPHASGPVFSSKSKTRSVSDAPTSRSRTKRIACQRWLPRSINRNGFVVCSAMMSFVLRTIKSIYVMQAIPAQKRELHCVPATITSTMPSRTYNSVVSRRMTPETRTKNSKGIKSSLARTLRMCI
jgi:hypothetical protein